MTTAVDPVLVGRSVFLSASIPNPARWAGDFDAFEITDAVVAVARTILTAGATLVTAAHPTIAPLVLYVAAELPESPEPRVVVYQSAVFEGVMPEATRRFEADGTGLVIYTEPVDDEPPDPELAAKSLALMRQRMLAETRPDAAVFIGGMGGISDEFRLLRELRPGVPTYPLGRPGGAARELASSSGSLLRESLLNGAVYPAVGRAIIEDLCNSLST